MSYSCSTWGSGNGLAARDKLELEYVASVGDSTLSVCLHLGLLLFPVEELKRFYSAVDYMAHPDISLEHSDILLKLKS